MHNVPDVLLGAVCPDFQTHIPSYAYYPVCLDLFLAERRYRSYQLKLRYESVFLTHQMCKMYIKASAKSRDSNIVGR